MSKKAVKNNATATAAKAQCASVSNSSPFASNETTIVEKFRSCCSTQTFALFWLDENLNPKDPKCRQMMAGLQKIANKIDVFDDLDPCLKLISNVREHDAYLIISNPKENVLDKSNRLPQLTAIFLFADRNSLKPESWRRWPKVRGVYDNVDDLCQSIVAASKNSDEGGMAMAFVSANAIGVRKLDELDQSFMYTQLMKEILVQMDYKQESVQELANFCRQLFTRNPEELQNVHEFATQYRKETSIWWYTRNTFVFRMVNRALREQTFDIIIKMGFIIKDLHQSLVELQDQQKLRQSQQLTLYRGQGMSKDDFEKVRKNRGGLMAFNNFSSTSRNMGKAEEFLQTALADRTKIGVFFIINVNPKVSSAVYADISNISFYRTEAEILFSLATTFRIAKIEEKRHFDRSWNVHLELTGDTDKELTRVMDFLRVEIGGSTPSYRLGALMIRVGQYDKAEEIFRRLWNDTTDQNEKGNLCYQLGFIKYHQKRPQEALRLYQDALRIHRETFGDNHQNVASVYNNIGLAYDDLDDRQHALEYYQKARPIYEKLQPNSAALAACYNNIASIYDHQKNYAKALEFYEKARNIYRVELGTNHPDLAKAENNTGLVYLKLNQNKEALQCFQKAMSIGMKTLPPDHPDLEAYKKHLDTVSTKAKNYK